MNKKWMILYDVIIFIFFVLVYAAMFALPVLAAVDINNVSVSAIKTNSVVIRWDATVAGTSQIEYGQTESYGNITEEESLFYFHTTELTGLNAGTAYHYRIRSKEYGGAETVSPDYTFITRTQTELDTVITAERQLQGAPTLTPNTYYVKTDGDDDLDGLTPDTAWQSPSVAVARAYAGDTIYLLNGTWDQIVITFPRSGIDVATITLTGSGVQSILNESSISIGDSSNPRAYINISNLKVNVVGVRRGSYINISNVEMGNTIGIAGNFLDCTYCTLTNCDIHDTGWNSWMVQTNYHPTHHIVIANNKIHDNPGNSGGEGHNFIDLFNYGTVYSISYLNIFGNEIYGGGAYNGAFFEHGGTVTTMYYIAIGSNIIHNAGRSCVNYLQNSIIYNNSLYDLPGAGFESYGGTTDQVLFFGNTIKNTTGNQVSLTPEESVIFDGNDITYYRINVKNGIVRNPVNEAFSIRSEYEGKIFVQFSHNIVFRENGGNTVKYYPDRSEYETAENESVSITTYLMSARPTTGPATVTVNSFDTSLSFGSVLADFTADTTDGNKVDFVIGDLKAETNYQVKRDSINYHVVKSNTNQCIAFSNSEWSQKTFTVEETDSEADIITPPDVYIGAPTEPSSPQNLAATAGNRRVVLVWKVPDDDGGYAVTNYKIYRGFSRGGETFLAQIGPILSYEDTGVSNGMTYYYQVTAINSVGESAKSNEVNVTPSAVRTDLAKAVVYPNPYIKGKSLNEIINFSNLPNEATIRIHTVTGKLIKTIKHKDTADGGSREWDVSEISSGIYLYTIISPEGKKTGKVSIIK